MTAGGEGFQLGAMWPALSCNIYLVGCCMGARAGSEPASGEIGRGLLERSGALRCLREKGRVSQVLLGLYFEGDPKCYKVAHETMSPSIDGAHIMMLQKRDGEISTPESPGRLYFPGERHPAKQIKKW